MYVHPLRLLVLLALSIMLALHTSPAQAGTGLGRLGLLSPNTAAALATEYEALTQRLHDLGYPTGHNLVIEARFAAGDLARLPALVAELLHLQVDCLVTTGLTATHAAHQATRTLPIVMMAASDDPVRHRLIASWA